MIPWTYNFFFFFFLLKEFFNFIEYYKNSKTFNISSSNSNVPSLKKKSYSKIQKVIVKEKVSIFQTMLNFVVRKMFWSVYTCLNFYNFRGKFVPPATRCKIIFEKDKFTIVKIQASCFKTRPSGSLYDLFLRSYIISLNYHWYTYGEKPKLRSD